MPIVAIGSIWASLLKLSNCFYAGIVNEKSIAPAEILVGTLIADGLSRKKKHFIWT